MKRDNSLQVYYNERLVGTLAMTAGRKIAFQYSKSWIEKGFQCGIIMSETRLFPSEKCEGYFGTKRFDRAVDTRGEKKIHMLTAAALLELDFEQPSMDYHGLMKLTKILTNNNEMDLENMFRRMCFNVFAHNRDDHSKNFTFLYDEENDSWRLSPAYDLTYSNTYYGEHTTSVDGNDVIREKKKFLQWA